MKRWSRAWRYHPPPPPAPEVESVSQPRPRIQTEQNSSVGPTDERGRTGAGPTPQSPSGRRTLTSFEGSDVHCVLPLSRSGIMLHRPAQRTWWTSPACFPPARLMQQIFRKSSRFPPVADSPSEWGICESFCVPKEHVFRSCVKRSAHSAAEERRRHLLFRTLGDGNVDHLPLRGPPAFGFASVRFITVPPTSA